MVADGLLPAEARALRRHEELYSTGHELLPLTPDGEILWQNAWLEFKSGAK